MAEKKKEIRKGGLFSNWIVRNLLTAFIVVAVLVVAAV
jgi:hypothetical protein